MTLFLTIIHVTVCFVLILVILLQAGRSQGLTGGGLGSGNVQSLLGTGASDFLTKATTISAIFFLFTCIGLDVIEARKSKSLMNFSSKPREVMDLNSIQEALARVKKEEESAKGKAIADAADKGLAETTAKVDQASQKTDGLLEKTSEQIPSTQATAKDAAKAVEASKS